MTSAPHARPTLRLALDAAAAVLAEGPHAARARRDTENLLLHALRLNPLHDGPAINLAWLIAHDGDPLPSDAAAVFCDLVERRLAGEPIQYILGHAEFFGLPFQVSRDVLIPRPETELLVERAIALAQDLHHSRSLLPPRIADVGTGSGCIAVALAHALPFAQIVATDLSAAALALASDNAARNRVDSRIRFLAGDLLDPVQRQPFDLIVSNPPYVAENDRAGLDLEVRDYEPAQALFAGSDGLAIYRRLIPAAARALVPGGILLLEIGHGQQAAIHRLCQSQRLAPIQFLPDLQGIPRVAIARKN